MNHALHPVAYLDFAHQYTPTSAPEFNVFERNIRSHDSMAITKSRNTLQARILVPESLDYWTVVTAMIITARSESLSTEHCA